MSNVKRLESAYRKSNQLSTVIDYYRIKLSEDLIMRRIEETSKGDKHLFNDWLSLHKESTQVKNLNICQLRSDFLRQIQIVKAK